MTTKNYYRNGKLVILEDFTNLFSMMQPGFDKKAIRAKFHEKAAGNPATNEDTPITVFQNVQLYEKCHPKQDLIFFIYVFQKYGNIRKALMEFDASTSAVINRKCSIYGITDTFTGKADMTLSRIIRAFPVNTAEVILKEKFQGILPYSSFFQQHLPLIMQHNIFSGLLIPFHFPELLQIAEVLNMEITVKLARAEEKKNYMMKTVGDFIKYSNKHVEDVMLSRLDDGNAKIKILIEAGIVEVKGKEFELSATTLALVNKLEYIKAVHALKYSDALEKLKN